jgi:hypothetical protein
MNEVTSVLDRYPDEVAGLSTGRLEQEVGELSRIEDVARAKRHRRVAELERRRVGAGGQDGPVHTSSTASWLATEQGMSWGEAKREVRTALALEDMPLTRQALSRGEISGSVARVLVEARQAHPRAFPTVEGMVRVDGELDPEGWEGLLTALGAITDAWGPDR